MRSKSITKQIGILTVEETAAALGISVATLWRWRARGELKGRRVLGRTVFDRTEVESVAKKRRAAAAG